MTARAVMVLGTSSHAGKTLLTAALCRIGRPRRCRLRLLGLCRRSATNFVLLRLPGSVDCPRREEQLIRVHHMVVRNCANYEELSGGACESQSAPGRKRTSARGAGAGSPSGDGSGETALMRFCLIRRRGLYPAVLSVVCVLVFAAISAQAEPQRIVSTSPSITEALFALGLGPRVVGVSNYCEYPPQVKNLPKVGTFLNPDPERIARLKPDLVIVHKLPNELTNRLNALHIPYAEVDLGGLTDAYSEIQQIGAATGAKEQAEKLVATIRSRLDHIHAQTLGRNKPRVIFIIGRDPGTLSNIIAVGEDDFLNALIDVAGGINVIAQESTQAYPRISLETILREHPDVLIDMGDMGDSPEERQRKAADNRVLWNAVPNLSAVQNGRVYCLTSTAFVVPGPRVSEAAEILFSILHGKKSE